MERLDAIKIRRTAPNKITNYINHSAKRKINLAMQILQYQSFLFCKA